jgi:hypothetical protein
VKVVIDGCKRQAVNETSPRWRRAEKDASAYTYINIFIKMKQQMVMKLLFNSKNMVA